MNRETMLGQIEHDVNQVWDVIVIGGGATGLGTAMDAASRGYKTLLLEQHDFSKGTSSRSTKLVHGGVRYLAQGDVSLVLEALHERGLMYQNAPHLVKNQPFVIPNYQWWGGPFYTIGLKVYDMMAGKLGLGPSISIDKEEVIAKIPNIRQEGLLGGVVYHDGQFDDARMAINVAQTCAENGGVLINYMRVDNLIKKDGMVSGVVATDLETSKCYHLNGRVVINATGVFVDQILRMDAPDALPTVKPSQGVHIILNKEFLQGEAAIMIPQTDDGRVLFAVPWHGKVVVGTTDTQVDQAVLEPVALKEEIDFILSTAGRYLAKPPSKNDVQSIFAGLRPLAAPKEGETSTKEISRGHKIMVSTTGLVTIIGGKWTTFRKMAEETVDKAAMIGGLHERACVTTHMAIHGYVKNIDRQNHMHVYGSDIPYIKDLMIKNSSWAKPIHKRLPFTMAEVVWAVRYEMARSVEDVLSRRVRALLLDARAAIDMAPEVARNMAIELGKDEAWIQAQIDSFDQLAANYLLVPYQRESHI
ncbi:MAG: glycerol-3-phosphate dehydrogenase/oxidase [Cyclobacteriaceae bacterium]|nr:glycerol-3-phosphate dehydrogenase/oxidase [Cyclobacteriaceae bacterium]